jgi:hypothetical protein
MDYEIERKKMSENRYIVEKYFGLSHLHDCAKRAPFTTIIKNTIDAMFQQFALGSHSFIGVVRSNTEKWQINLWKFAQIEAKYHLL